MSRDSHYRNRQPRSRLDRSDRNTGHPETRIQKLTAELASMRTELTDLRLREAMARRRAEALQAEVERLKSALAKGLLGQLKMFWRGVASRGVAAN